MNVFQHYLDQHHVTRYRVSKISGVGQTTLLRASQSTSGTDRLSGRVIKAIARAVNKTPGQVLDELITLEQRLDEERLEQK
ncbi:hypothetical protein [Lactiplantibacillus modestisalitolerans]|uniref:HTH cro/C1-type domain-containing protein n=1 Tax=Lactiplantibacillus modestisalitolerans TaxID=1457219 RepID=A0ABV5WX32_9LACO|nr:hypothetical protein [Lactiplantibacillus modestisalitolerans]